MALKDITLGQYFPGNSPVHRLDPRTIRVGCCDSSPTRCEGTECASFQLK